MRIAGLNPANIGPQKPSLGPLGRVPHAAPHHLCATCPARRTVFTPGHRSYPSVPRNTSIYEIELYLLYLHNLNSDQLLQLDCKEEVVYTLTTLCNLFFKTTLCHYTIIRILLRIKEVKALTCTRSHNHWVAEPELKPTLA